MYSSCRPKSTQKCARLQQMRVVHVSADFRYHAQVLRLVKMLCAHGRACANLVFASGGVQQVAETLALVLGAFSTLPSAS